MTDQHSRTSTANQTSQPDPNIVCWVRPNSSQLFFVYQGHGHALMIHALKFLQMTGLLNRNVVMFRDVYRCWYLRGVSEQIASAGQLLQWQHNYLSHMTHVRDVYCLGTSTGGFAALLYGHLLGVRSVFAFAPCTIISTAVLEQIREQTGEAPPYQDLATVLAHSNERSNYKVYYNERHETDKQAAQHISHCPGVVLHPQSGSGHSVVVHMANTRQLQHLLPN